MPDPRTPGTHAPGTHAPGMHPPGTHARGTHARDPQAPDHGTQDSHTQDPRTPDLDVQDPRTQDRGTPGSQAPAPSPAPNTDGARARLAAAQTALLSALVAGAPDPPGFDTARLETQRRALRAKRADVVAKVAPELPGILGPATYRTLFLAYAATHPLTAGYRHDALAFAGHVLATGTAPDRSARRALRRWHAVRARAVPPLTHRVRTLLGR